MADQERSPKKRTLNSKEEATRFTDKESSEATYRSRSLGVRELSASPSIIRSSGQGRWPPSAPDDGGEGGRPDIAMGRGKGARKGRMGQRQGDLPLIAPSAGQPQRNNTREGLGHIEFHPLLTPFMEFNSQTWTYVQRYLNQADMNTRVARERTFFLKKLIDLTWASKVIYLRAQWKSENVIVIIAHLGHFVRVVFV